jgi:hypothetical protein
MRNRHDLLLRYLYPRAENVYLRDLLEVSPSEARATFVFGHNPRTSDFTHVGAAEMLAGVSQAAYCMTLTRAPELFKEDAISRCCFSAVKVTFSKMLAPETEASLMLEMEMLPSGLPRFHFEGFINGSVECGFADAEIGKHVSDESDDLPLSVRRTLHSFYNNGSELTLKCLAPVAANRWASRSTFTPDSRLRLCRYTTTTQVIVGLSQLAFAVVGESNSASSSAVNQAANLDEAEFRDSMSDQALVKLDYRRPPSSVLDVRLDTTLSASRNLKRCKFVRLKLDGDLNGTMDCMLSPRVPIKSFRRVAQS